MKLNSLILEVIAAKTLDNRTRANPDCQDYELALKCENSCETRLERCISDCGPDTSCISSCTRTHAFCLDECPCNANCPSGCESCPNSAFCSSVLVLNTAQQNTPLLYNYGMGDLSENLDFTIKSDAEVWMSCSTIFQGEMMIFGGNSPADSSTYARKQISKINPNKCKLKRLEENLPFEFFLGTCGTYNFVNGGEKVLLCFDIDEMDGCRTYDGTTFEMLETRTSFPHGYTRLGNYQGRPFVVGNYWPNSHARPEVMNLETLEWQTKTIYPFASSICRYAVANTSDSLFVFGGYQYPEIAIPTVARLRYDSWSKMGELLNPRYYHSAILVGDEVLVVGGRGTYHNEIWKITSNGDIELKEEQNTEYKLTYYTEYPELFHVPYNFCLTEPSNLTYINTTF